MIIRKISAEKVLLLSIGLVLGGSCMFLKPQTGHESNHIGTRLNEIQSQLGALQEAVKAPAEKIDLSSINQDFNRLATLIGELKSKDEGQLNQLVVESRTQLANKLDAMHSVINSLDKKQHPVKYLPVTVLPFKVISIDSIQQVSVASVAYDFKTVPLEKSDTLAGWTVLSVDFGKQSIELENKNKEHVIVALEGVSEHA